MATKFPSSDSDSKEKVSSIISPTLGSRCSSIDDNSSIWQHFLFAQTFVPNLRSLSYSKYLDHYSLFDLLDLDESEKCHLDHVKDWLLGIFPDNMPGLNKDLISCDHQIPAFNYKTSPNIKPFYYNFKNRPDICVNFHYKSVGSMHKIYEDIEFPGLLIEVMSGKKTLSQNLCDCLVLMIDQFRFVSLYFQITNISGYLFPKADHKCKALVTRIDLQWKDLQFDLNFVHLGKEQVSQDVKQVLSEQCFGDNLTLVSSLPHSAFLRLSDADLTNISNQIQSTSTLEQISTGSSIMFRNKEFYYKILPNYQHERAISGMYISFLDYQSSNSDLLKYFVPPNRLLKLGPEANIPCYRFERQTYDPLSRKEAKKCIIDLISQLTHSLQVLHAELFLAHLDVRLPNICFDDDGNARLIDFDFSQSSKSSRIFRKEYPFLYNPPRKRTNGTTWTCGDLDFKQLGVMIFCIYIPGYHQTTVEEESVRETLDLSGNAGDVLLKFARQLIFNCTHNGVESLKCHSKYAASSTVLEVLHNRI
ncbi:hypothetical protein LOD99_12225 [Oopsacas minuta]|uniref:Protein kinase domain-containing protein n=1 Tax=Oopsacas minuta TaxID=111878 RepID=A0AAV7JEV6_9METZ|nr:hypothetical protein LOD99_12225 [Oopsacas minuta]